MKEAIAFGSLVGLVLVSVVTFNTVLDSKVAISEIMSKPQTAAVADVIGISNTQQAINTLVMAKFNLALLKSRVTLPVAVGSVAMGATDYNMLAVQLINLCSSLDLLGSPCSPTAVKVGGPNGGEWWQTGTTQSIGWGQQKEFYPYLGVAGPVQIDLIGVTNPAFTQVLASNVPNTVTNFSWAIPTSIPNGTYRVKLTGCATTNFPNNFPVVPCTDTSDQPFTISNQSGTTTASTTVKVLSPNGGETFVAGQNLPITWQVTGLDKVRITLRKGGVIKQDIVTSVANTGSYNWIIPAGMALGNDYQIRVRDAIAGGTPKYFDDSDAKFSIVAATTTTSAQLQVALASDNPPTSMVVIDESNNTDDVVLLKGTLKATGSDVTINTLPITFTTTGGASVVAVTGLVTLVLDGEEFVESVSSVALAGVTGSVIFDGLDLTINKDDTVSFIVQANINDIEPGQLDEGDRIRASLDVANRDAIDSEDSAGNDLPKDKKMGTAIGNDQELRSHGIQVTLVSTNTDAQVGTSVNDDIGLFTIKFKVTAVGSDVYLSSVAGAKGVQFLVDRAGVPALSAGVQAALANVTDTDLTAAGLYRIDEGNGETFQLTATAQLPAAGTAGQYRASVTGIKWGVTDNVNLPNFLNTGLEALKTSYKALN